MIKCLIDVGLTGNVVSIIKAIYENSLNCIKLNGEQSDWFRTENGVKQGDNLSPTLFACYINDLLVEIDHKCKGVTVGHGTSKVTVRVLAYVDDLVLVAESQDDLQEMLHVVEQWCHKNRLTLNVKKTTRLRSAIGRACILWNIKYSIGNRYMS